MPSLSELYQDLPDEGMGSQTGLYRVTNTHWVAENTPDAPIILTSNDYTQLITIQTGPPSSTHAHKISWPYKPLCQTSLFFRSICMPSTPITPDPTPHYIRTLRQHFHTTAQIPFPCPTPLHRDALAIFLSWNAHGDITHAPQFAGITATGTDPIAVQLAKYARLWNQLIACHALAHLLTAPAFGNAVIDAMIRALDEEASVQTKRRKMEDDARELERPPMPQSQAEYDRAMRRLVEEDASVRNPQATHWIAAGVPSFAAWNALRMWSRREILRRPLVLPPDCRHVLGATPAQISVFYAETERGSLLRQMLVDMIVSYSTRFPKYYGQKGGFGMLLGGAAEGQPGAEFRVPVEFVQDLLARYALVARGDRGVRNAEFVDRCRYHDHRHGAACSRRNEVAYAYAYAPALAPAQAPAANFNADELTAVDALIILSGTGN
ncbi:hypothetical protein DSL72_006268 [Monilinia vaccinii-corymbosi]|uniref:Uncharacterized protein n=1 Tax=Monilinia vaccinii-corymbosi TaxID=61207 RepID=A0A8A3PLT2_9HELO|nr:hypothetical protein DSL72_006268 [Monilinia vaccinii-corymbosi]